jgi:aminoglycoside phosphotransferase family enzyme
VTPSTLPAAMPVPQALVGLLQPRRVVETHAAYVFLTDTQALKLRKTVRTPFADNLDVESRLKGSRAEIAVNHALAPHVYLGLKAVLRGPAGQVELADAPDEEAAAIDWLVVMRRLPDDRMLDQMLGRGEVPAPRDLDALAALLAPFYRHHRAKPAEHGLYLDRLRREGWLNERHLMCWEGALCPEGRTLCAEAMRRLDEVADEITTREAAGLVVDGHGDLRPEHVCLTDPPVIFDRIEFSKVVRLVDVHDEIGFLGLEARLMGDAALGNELTARLVTAGFPAPSPRLQATYALHRCLTRARLTIDHLLDAEPRTPAKWPARAMRYIDEARRLMEHA